MTIDVVDVERYAVFFDCDVTRQIRRQSGQFDKSLRLFEPLETARRHIAALVYRSYILTKFRQFFDEYAEKLHFNQVYAQAHHLNRQDIAKFIDDKTGKLIRFAEDESASPEIASHHRFAISECVANAATPKGLVEFVVGIGRYDAHADFALAIDESRSKISAFGTAHIDE